MKFGAVISGVALSALLVGASPVSASVVDLHTLSDGNTFWGNGHSNNLLSSATTTDTYDFKLSSSTGFSSLTVLDGFLGFSGVTLELFNGFGASATQIASVTFPSLGAGDPLLLGATDLANGKYKLEVIDTLPQATEEKIGRHWVTFPSTGGYVLDFDVHSFSPIDPPSGSVSAVPEPSTWAMMLLGFFGLAFLAHRRRAAGKALLGPA